MENILQKVGCTSKYFAKKWGLAFYWKNTSIIIIEIILPKINYNGKYFAILSLK
ncbi:hypothetical protein [Pricia sp.]|uniref:hypothetical protein n=1 Tax=Pricia sp. TaxID=2268138 RepID=UPI0035946EC6